MRGCGDVCSRDSFHSFPVYFGLHVPLQALWVFFLTGLMIWEVGGYMLVKVRWIGAKLGEGGFQPLYGRVIRWRDIISCQWTGKDGGELIVHRIADENEASRVTFHVPHDSQSHGGALSHKVLPLGEEGGKHETMRVRCKAERLLRGRAQGRYQRRQRGGASRGVGVFSAGSYGNRGDP
jgi:hypothetical protein